MTNLLKKEKGFTLIEIVLVLAIAGLLLVIVFLAVSGAQRSRRDTQRKNDVSRIAGHLESYASNNDGKYPASAAEFGPFKTTYITPPATAPPANLNSPSTGTVYDVQFIGAVPPANPTAVDLDDVNVYITGRQYLVCIGLEQGVNCRNNR